MIGRAAYHEPGNILAAVDPGQNQIRQVIHYLPHAHDHAIGWGAIQGKLVFRYFAQTQRIAERQGVCQTGLICFRCHCPDLIRKLPGNFFQGNEPSGINTVIVGQQYLQLINPPSQCVSDHPYRAAGNREP